MSVEAWSAVLNAKIDNSAKKMVLLGLANHAGPTGSHCFPSVKRLCIYSGLGESTVRTKLRELRDEGLIKVDKESTRYRPTEYSISINRLETMKDPDLQLLEVSISTPTSRGSDNNDQTSSSQQPDLQETDIRPPAPEPEPSLTINESSNNRKRGDRPPAVELCKRIIFRYPHKSLWKTIDRNVGNELADLVRWGRIMRKWRLSNFNITNYKGMLENFNRDRKHDDNIDYMSDKNRRKYLKGWFDD